MSEEWQDTQDFPDEICVIQEESGKFIVVTGDYAESRSSMLIQLKKGTTFTVGVYKRVETGRFVKGKQVDEGPRV